MWLVSLPNCTYILLSNYYAVYLEGVRSGLPLNMTVANASGDFVLRYQLSTAMYKKIQIRFVCEVALPGR